MTRTFHSKNCTVEPVDTSEALAFIALNRGSAKGLPGKNPRSFGLKHKNELLAVAVFSNPRAADKQREYTTELFSLSYKNGVSIAAGPEKLIGHFMSLTNAIDFFAYASTLGETEAICEQLAMKLVERRARTETSKTPLPLSPQPSAPSDRFYEWKNSRYLFYTYRLTSSVDDGYYYGRHKTSLLTAEEMLLDGYMGSGGTKFRNWVKAVGEENILKEIVSIHDSWKAVVFSEMELIGDLYKTDHRCKNSKPGGVGVAGYFPKPHLKNCPLHGEVLHQGDSCKRCSAAKSFTRKPCSVHGVTLHQKESCLRCRASELRTVADCSIHGKADFVGDSCSLCVAQSSYKILACRLHGETIHQGDRCKKCVANDSVTMKSCSLHGTTKHIGDSCRKCINLSATKIAVCSIHGAVLHQGSRCSKCVSIGRVRLGNCSLHGEVKFLGSSCATCAAERSVGFRVCPTHGATKHVGDKCKRCMAAKVWSLQDCLRHGESKHRSGKCVKCAVAKPRSSS